MASKITNLTSDPKQSITIVSEDNITFTLYLQYYSNQEQWNYIVEYPTSNGIITRIGEWKLKTSNNILFNQRNILPFGIECISTDKGDPYFIDDFISVGGFLPRITLHCLGENDLIEFNNIIDDTDF